MTSIADILNPREPYSAAHSMVRLSALSATPNFELRFNIAQNRALDKLNEKITEINTSDFGRGKSALLRVKITRLERQKDGIQPYQATVDSNKAATKNAIDRLGELRDLADPASVAAFEAKLQQVLGTLGSMRTATRYDYGAPDRLAKARDSGRATLEAIAHNGFATPDDIAAAQAAIDTVTSSFNSSLAIQDVNAEMARGLYKSVDISLEKAKLKVDDLESAERQRQVAEIKKLEEQTARILTNISLSFEVAQGFAEAINKGLLPKQVEPGSVLNLFA